MSRDPSEATAMRTVVLPSTRSAPAAPLPARRGGRTRETVLFLGAIALIALHVIDDNLLQPQPGTVAGDHLVSGLVPLVLLGLAAWAYPRLRGGRRGALALLFGVLGLLGGVEAVHYTGTVGASGDDFTGLLSIPAGLLLLGLGAVTLWRTRRTEGNRPWRYARRALLAVATFVVATSILLPFGVAYVVTHTARAVVPPNHLGVAHEDVKFETSDGLELEGWYIPSRNGAAVIAFPGRNGPQKQARMLARHGYGVLLFDRRGEGESDGEPNIFGWGGERDVKAAIAFLQRRPDVDPDRIGGIGLSVGGEMMLEAAAETDQLAAVVSEGAGPRAYSDEMDQDLSGTEKLMNAVPSAIKTASLAVLTNQAPPANLKDLVGRIAPRPILLIAAPNSPNGEDLNRGYYKAAGEPKTLWEIPESKHVGGLAARPAEYERRVIGFFDEALR
jgi:MYXO-CTERM domain-containing protein